MALERREAYLAAGGGILEGVVQQDGDKLTDAGAVAVHAHAVLNALGERFALCLSERAHRLRDLPYHVAQHEVRLLRQGLLLIKARERHQRVYELCEPLHLKLNVLHPLVVLIVHGEHVRACGDGGQRGL